MPTTTRAGGPIRAFTLVRRALSMLRRRSAVDRGPIQSDLAYWRQRVRTYGARAVLNLHHGESEYEVVTQEQMRILLPAFARLLDGSERIILDFGCGAGRFTPALGQFNARCVGVDPVRELLQLGPRRPQVSYVAMPDGAIPLATDSVDALWCCLVLGGLRETSLQKTILEFKRVLRPRGLLFLAENTAAAEDALHWRFRSASWYAAALPWVPLATVATYVDCDEPITVMAGRVADPATREPCSKAQLAAGHQSNR